MRGWMLGDASLCVSHCQGQCTLASDMWPLAQCGTSDLHPPTAARTIPSPAQAVQAGPGYVDTREYSNARRQILLPRHERVRKWWSAVSKQYHFNADTTRWMNLKIKFKKDQNLGLQKVRPCLVMVTAPLPDLATLSDGPRLWLASRVNPGLSLVNTLSFLRTSHMSLVQCIVAKSNLFRYRCWYYSNKFHSLSSSFIFVIQLSPRISSSRSILVAASMAVCS